MGHARERNFNRKRPASVLANDGERTEPSEWIADK